MLLMVEIEYKMHGMLLILEIQYRIYCMLIIYSYSTGYTACYKYKYKVLDKFNITNIEIQLMIHLLLLIVKIQYKIHCMLLLVELH